MKQPKFWKLPSKDIYPLEDSEAKVMALSYPYCHGQLIPTTFLPFPQSLLFYLRVSYSTFINFCVTEQELLSNKEVLTLQPKLRVSAAH